MALLSPPVLKKGDKIAIFAPARKVSKSDLEKSIEIFTSWGLEVVFTPNLFAEDHQFAGTDQQRKDDLQWLIDHPNIKAAIAARGGYGCSRFVDKLNFDSLEKYPKWFIGFSDVTVILSSLYKNGFKGIHGPVCLTLGKEGQEQNALTLQNILFGNQLPTLYATPNTLNKFGSASGTLIGGNLTILHTLLNTSSDLDYTGKLLFIEDLDEYLYHIDRMMVHLERAGKLKNLAGLVIGSLSDMRDNAIPFGKNAEEIVAHWTSKYQFPVCFQMPIGHDAQNTPVVIGEMYRLVVSEKNATLSPVVNLSL
jgi:muramoyltetrapeptide carboxypeptidase